MIPPFRCVVWGSTHSHMSWVFETSPRYRGSPRGSRRPGLSHVKLEKLQKLTQYWVLSAFAAVSHPSLNDTFTQSQHISTLPSPFVPEPSPRGPRALHDHDLRDLRDTRLESWICWSNGFFICTVTVTVSVSSSQTYMYCNCTVTVSSSALQSFVWTLIIFDSGWDMMYYGVVLRPSWNLFLPNLGSCLNHLDRELSNCWGNTTISPHQILYLQIRIWHMWLNVGFANIPIYPIFCGWILDSDPKNPKNPDLSKCYPKAGHKRLSMQLGRFWFHHAHHAHHAQRHAVPGITKGCSSNLTCWGMFHRYL